MLRMSCMFLSCCLTIMASKVTNMNSVNKE